MTLASDDIGHHISQQYNEDLINLRDKVLEMGQLVARQLREAIAAISGSAPEFANQVLGRESEVNALELELDEECGRVIVRRQPAAGDLRLIFAFIKGITDLERMGDQAKRVARTALETAGAPQDRFGMPMRRLGNLVLDQVDKALDAFARLDVATALAVARDDKIVDLECKSISRELLTYMMEDPRTIGPAFQLVWAARALERAGDHAKNLAEYVVYAVHGRDLRHMSVDERERQLQAVAPQ